MSDLVHRLRLIVAEPEAWCKTDVEYVEDAADEIERLRAECDRLAMRNTHLVLECERLNGNLAEVKTRTVRLLSQLQEFEAREQ
jgi:hypothetical protein